MELHNTNIRLFFDSLDGLWKAEIREQYSGLITGKTCEDVLSKIGYKISEISYQKLESQHKNYERTKYGESISVSWSEWGELKPIPRLLIYRTYKTQENKYWIRDLENKIKIVITENEYSTLIKPLESLNNNIPEKTMGLDGSIYSVRVTKGFNAFEYHWWGGSGKQWNGIIEFKKNLERILENNKKTSA